MDFLLLNLDVIIYILTFVQLCDRDSLMIAAPKFFTPAMMLRVDDLMKRNFQYAFKVLRKFGKITDRTVANRVIRCYYNRSCIYGLLKTYFSGVGKFSHIKSRSQYHELMNPRVEQGLKHVQFKENYWYLNHKYYVVDNVKCAASYSSVVTQGTKEDTLYFLYDLVEYGFRFMPEKGIILHLIDYKDFGNTKIYLNSSWAKKFITRLLAYHCFEDLFEFFVRYSTFEYNSDTIFIDTWKKFRDFRLAFIEGCPGNRLTEFLVVYKLEHHYERLAEKYGNLNFQKFCRLFFRIDDE